MSRSPKEFLLKFVEKLGSSRTCLSLILTFKKGKNGINFISHSLHESSSAETVLSIGCEIGDSELGLEGKYMLKTLLLLTETITINAPNDYNYEVLKTLNWSGIPLKHIVSPSSIPSKLQEIFKDASYSPLQISFIVKHGNLPKSTKIIFVGRDHKIYEGSIKDLVNALESSEDIYKESKENKATCTENLKKLNIKWQGKICKYYAETCVKLYKQAMEESVMKHPVIPKEILEAYHEKLQIEVCDIYSEMTSQYFEMDVLKLQILNQAKDIYNEMMKKNNNKKPILKGVSFERGRFKSIPEKYIKEIQFNSMPSASEVIATVEKFMCDFGTEKEKFCSSIWGYWKKMSNCLTENIKNKLLFSNSCRELLKSHMIKTDPPSEFNVDIGSYVKFSPIEIKFFGHNPELLVQQEENKVEYIKKLMKISHERQSQIVLNKEVSILNISYKNIKVKIRADFEVTIEKYFRTKMWTKISSLGINNAFDQDKTYNANFPAALTLGLEPSFIEFIENKNNPRDVNMDDARDFMKKYNVFQDFAKALCSNGNGQNNLSQDHLNEQGFSEEEEKVPLQYIHPTNPQNRNKSYYQDRYENPNDKMRKGELEALLGIAKHDEANITRKGLGDAFENVAARKFHAEAEHKGVKLEYYRGDGVDEINFQGNNHKTPIGTDAIFRDTKTGQVINHQYKASELPENAKEMAIKDYKKYKVDSAQAGQRNEFEKAYGPQNSEVISCKGNKGHADLHLEGTTKKVEIKDTMQHEQINPDGSKKKVKVEAPSAKETQRWVENNQENAIEYRKLNEKKINLENQKAKAETNLKNKQAGLEKVQDKLKKSPTDNLAQQKQETLLKQIAGHEAEIEDLSQEIKAKEKLILENDKKVTKMLPRKNFVKDAAKKGAAVGALAGVLHEGVIACVEEIQKVNRNEISKATCAKNIALRVAKKGGMGAAMGAGIGGIEAWGTVAIKHGAQGFKGAIAPIAQRAGLVVAIAFTCYSSLKALELWNKGEITTGARNRLIARSVATTSSTLAAGYGAVALISGPIGWVVALGVCIGIGITDHFFGDELWKKLGFEDDPEEAEKILKKEFNKLQADALDAAYKLFDLTDKATDDELKEVYKRTVLATHPDKGGSEEKFNAVHTAYAFIMYSRGNDKAPLFIGSEVGMIEFNPEKFEEKLEEEQEKEEKKEEDKKKGKKEEKRKEKIRIKKKRL